MDVKEFEDKLANVLLQKDVMKQWLDRLNKLDKKIQENESELDRNTIKIPFIHKRIIDNLGIIKHKVPTLLNQNAIMVNKYNKLLAKFDELHAKTVTTFDELVADYRNSTGKIKNDKTIVLDKYFPVQ